jgi:hypothetical protein
MNALELFRTGKDTLQIAEHLGGLAKGWTEAKVYNAIAKEKADELKRKASMPLVRYAGYERSSQPWGGR